MSYPFNYPTPQNANIQIFREGGSTSDWIKPQGASFVWFTLIGPGGGGGGWNPGITDAGGGGSGAVVNFMCPAFLIPDELRVFVGQGGAAGNSSDGFPGTNTTITYHQQKSSSGYTLLTAQSGLGGTTAGGGGAGGTASSNNFFTAMGFFNSVAGQAGATIPSNITASGTTFLSGGSAGGSNGALTANYGYGNSSGANKAGFFQMQPIIVGVGGNRCSLGDVNACITGTGCGGSGGSGTVIGSRGGDGLVVIITW